jgi:tRNA dimethylallyltransferase
MQQAVIFLMGPTASGKTALALEWAERWPVDVISVDSALIYRDMNIGTAKPDAATLAQVPHALVDIVDPTEAYSAARFVADARHHIQQSHAAGRIPLLVGGTMLYFKALREGLHELPVANPAVRAQISAEAAEQGWPALHAELAQVDAQTAARLSPNDSQRIERALDIYRSTGKSMTAWLADAPPAPSWPNLMAIALEPGERAVLHQRIEQRWHDMLQQGLIDEVAQLRQKYALDPDLPSMRCVGYRQSWDYLDHKISYAELAAQGLFATRQLAKRQLTWLRGMPDLLRLDPLAPDAIRHTTQKLQRWLEGKA